MTLAFCCRWTDGPRTWSYIPWSLQHALAALTEVVPVDATVPRPLADLNRMAARVALGSTSAARETRVALAASALRTRQGVRRTRSTIALEIGDIGGVGVPFFLYQDLSYGVLAQLRTEMPAAWLGVPALPDRAFERRARRSLRIYERAAGVFTMSKWLADELVRSGALPSERVHVVHAGRTAVVHERRVERDRYRRRRRVLFVGRDFIRKGGDVVVAAVSSLRRSGENVELTIAGPELDPASRVVDRDGVTYLGPLPPSGIAALLVDHDLFVMPSRFEAFGIAFVEALAAGIPCIGRDAFAMPEIIDDGRTGRLVRSEGVDELATAIFDVLHDDQMHDACQRQRDDVAAYYSWDGVARRILEVAEW